MIDPPLAPCPFCGGLSEPRQTTLPAGAMRYTIGCLSCAAVGPWDKSGPEGAAERWNARAGRLQRERRRLWILRGAATLALLAAVGALVGLVWILGG